MFVLCFATILAVTMAAPMTTTSAPMTTTPASMTTTPASMTTTPASMTTTPMSALSLVQRLKLSYGNLDRNGDGKATVEEFGMALASLDVDKNNKITLAEYAVGANIDMKTISPIFHHFDQNRNGYLDNSDLKVAFHQYDVDSNGEVDFNEFVAQYVAMVKLVASAMLPSTTMPTPTMPTTTMTTTTMPTATYSPQLRLHMAFMGLDLDGNGKATADEFNSLLHKMDADGNTEVTLSEYLKFTQADPQTITPVFHYFDANKNGHLDKQDFLIAFKMFDVNVDDYVSEKEFIIEYTAILKFLTPHTIG